MEVIQSQEQQKRGIADTLQVDTNRAEECNNAKSAEQAGGGGDCDLAQRNGRFWQTAAVSLDRCTVVVTMGLLTSKSRMRERTWLRGG